MALDAGMVACLCRELHDILSGGKVDKVYQPSKDEVVLTVRVGARTERLLLSCAPGSARGCLTDQKYENPAVPPMFCMLLRKHLSGAKLCSVSQPGFERVMIFAFDTRDELGFACEKYLVLELVGKFSNLIFLNEHKKIISAVRTVDFSDSDRRQILPGIAYELPPAQDKRNPLTESEQDFREKLSGAVGAADRYLVASYLGLSPLVAREIVYSAERETGRPVSECDPDRLWFYFHTVTERIRTGDYLPTLISDREGGAVEYSFMPIKQYGVGLVEEHPERASELLERFFRNRADRDRMRGRSADILRLLTNAQSRLERKIALQTEELADCAQMETYRLYGDLLTANLYALHRGKTIVSLPNYYDPDCAPVEIPLDGRLSPAANAQKYYKKYNKCKHAFRVLEEQIKRAREDIAYIDTVFDALCRAETTVDLDQIREELYHAGFASRMKDYEKKKQKPPAPLEFRTTGGLRVLCGRNNTQNDYLTTKLAAKSDYWFHVKDAPGSHVILCCEGRTPSDADLTEAAEIAAAHSKLAEGSNVPVDYTPVRYVKKPVGAKPGYVIYHTNRTAYVTPEKKN